MSLQKALQQSILWRGLYFVVILLLNIMVSRYLQATISGWLFYVSNVFAFMVMLTGFNVENGLSYVAAKNEALPPLVTWGTMATIVSALLLGVLYVFGVEVPQAPLGISVSDSTTYAFAYVLGILMQNIFCNLFFAKGSFVVPHTILVAINLLLIVYLWHLGRPPDHLHIKPYLDAFFYVHPIQGLVLLLVFAVLYKAWPMVQWPKWNTLVTVLRFSAMAFLGNAIFFLVYRVDYWFVQQATLQQPEALGNYIQASKLGQMLLIIPQILATAIFPQTAGRSNYDEIIKSVGSVSRLLWQAFLVIAITLIVTGEWLFTNVFGSSFATMHVPFLLLLPGLWGLSVLALLSAYFSGRGKVWVNIVGAAIALVIVLVACAIWVPAYGYVAAAIISSIAYLANTAFAWYQLQQYETISWRTLLGWRVTDYQWLWQLITGKHNTHHASKS
ncbi:MAG: lipopolysaccharide biosynthesis protein [Chitinophagaceae bacterium]